MAEKNNSAVTYEFYEDYFAGLVEVYTKGCVKGRESLATDILLILKECPNNVERIERIKEVCTKIINNKKQEENA